MKVLVTGATGLLGSDIVYMLENNNIETVKACFSQRNNNYIAADITTEEGISKLAGAEWDSLIHTSAWRDPDECENKQKETYRLNVWATGQLAETAYARNAKMIFISTDYVFSGNNPPYSETDIKDPINYYGKTKKTAEEKILDVSGDFCILRVPLLYGIRAGLKASALLNAAFNALNSDNTSQMNNTITRYPTYTGDVADAILFLLNKNAKGIYHFSGQDKTTKYHIAETIAELLNKKIENIIKMDIPPNDNARRPLDSHLSMDKLLSLGFEKPLPFKNRAEQLLKELNLI
jgi:dTDP-4-dehydrorhamnose reductase